jgi:hypothetical protein
LRKEEMGWKSKLTELEATGRKSAKLRREGHEKTRENQIKKGNGENEDSGKAVVK